MYEFKKIGKVFTSKYVVTGPSSYEKRVYRGAVSQRLRNTGLEDFLSFGPLYYSERNGFSKLPPEFHSRDLFLLYAFSGTGTHSDANRNEYQGLSLAVKCGRSLQLMTPPFWFCRISKWRWKRNIPPTSQVFMNYYGRPLPLPIPK